MGQKPSTIAVAALFNAMGSMLDVSEEAINDLRRELKRLPALDPSHEDVEGCRSRLRVLFAQGGYDRSESLIDSGARQDSISPVCVSYGVTPALTTYHNDTDRCTGSDMKTTKQLVEDSMQAD